MTHAVADAQGSRRYMEDTHFILEDVTEIYTGGDLKGKWAFYGVYDGHGGDVCSAWVKKHLHNDVLSSTLFPENIPAAMEEGLRATDASFASSNPKLLDDGSTAVFALLNTNEEDEDELWVANSGDSRAVLIEFDGSEFSGVPLSVDHKPSRPDEKERIKSAGGIVRKGAFFGSQGPDRVYDSSNRGGLAISRGVGDLLLKREPLVIVDPDIVHHTVNESSVGFVIASDGLWDVFSNKNVAAIVGEKLLAGESPAQIVHTLIAKALSGNNFSDNITVIFVLLNKPKE